MPNQLPISEVAKGFQFALTETFESVFGIYLDKGASLFETLAQISAAQASQPMRNCATIAAHVAHTTYYLTVLEDPALPPRPQRSQLGADLERNRRGR